MSDILPRVKVLAIPGVGNILYVEFAVYLLVLYGLPRHAARRLSSLTELLGLYELAVGLN